MHISASILNSSEQNEVIVATNNISKGLSIPPKPGGKGSSVNGGELLFLALATCFCNDIYREAARRHMEVASVEVKVSGQFGAEGEPGYDIQYEVRIDSKAPAEEVKDLVIFVDQVAEIHNTLRVGTSVTLVESNFSVR